MALHGQSQVKLKNNARCHKNHKNTGQITKIRAKYWRFFPNARIYGHTRINTGDFSTLVTILFSNNCFVNIYNQPRNAKEIYKCESKFIVNIHNQQGICLNFLKICIKIITRAYILTNEKPINLDWKDIN